MVVGPVITEAMTNGVEGAEDPDCNGAAEDENPDCNGASGAEYPDCNVAADAEDSGNNEAAGADDPGCNGAAEARLMSSAWVWYSLSLTVWILPLSVMGMSMEWIPLSSLFSESDKVEESHVYARSNCSSVTSSFEFAARSAQFGGTCLLSM